MAKRQSSKKRATGKSSKKASQKKLPWWMYLYLTIKYTVYGVYVIFKYVAIGLYRSVHLFVILISRLVAWIKKQNKKRRLAKEYTTKDDTTLSEKTVPEKNDESYQPFKVIETLKGSYDEFERLLFESKSTIGLILGARGTGKSTIGMRILENIHTKKDRACYAMGFDEKELPKWITSASDVSEIENDSVVLIDEGGILFSSRDAMKGANKILSELLLIARHRDLSILFITQNSSNLEVNVIRQADYLVLKPSSLLQRDFERKKIKAIYDEVSEKYAHHKNVKGITYIYSEQFKGFVSNGVPSFWSEKLSKSFG